MGSPNVIKVIILLEELNQPYEFIHVNVISGEQFQDDFIELNPNSKVPVLISEDKEGTHVVFESGAILQYLAEKNKFLWPDSVGERAKVNSWLQFQMASFGPMAGQAIHFNFATKEDSYARNRYTNELHRLINVIEKRLGDSQFIAGSEYSIADIAMIPWVATLQLYFKEDLEKPNISRWYRLLADRPAIARAMTTAKRLSKIDMNSIRLAEKSQLDRYFGRIPYDQK